MYDRWFSSQNEDTAKFISRMGDNKDTLTWRWRFRTVYCNLVCCSSSQPSGREVYFQRLNVNENCSSVSKCGVQRVHTDKPHVIKHRDGNLFKNEALKSCIKIFIIYCFLLLLLLFNLTQPWRSLHLPPIKNHCSRGLWVCNKGHLYWVRIVFNVNPDCNTFTTIG